MLHCVCDVPSVCWVCSGCPELGQQARGHSYHLKALRPGCEEAAGEKINVDLSCYHAHSQVLSQINASQNFELHSSRVACSPKEGL